MNSGRQRRIEALRETLSDSEFVRDHLKLWVTLQALREGGREVSRMSARSTEGRGAKGQTLSSLARKVMKSAHLLKSMKISYSVTEGTGWQEGAHSSSCVNDWRVFSTNWLYLRHLGSLCRAMEVQVSCLHPHAIYDGLALAHNTSTRPAPVLARPELQFNSCPRRLTLLLSCQLSKRITNPSRPTTRRKGRFTHGAGGAERGRGYTCRGSRCYRRRCSHPRLPWEYCCVEIERR